MALIECQGKRLAYTETARCSLSWVKRVAAVSRFDKVVNRRAGWWREVGLTGSRSRFLCEQFDHGTTSVL